MDNHLILKSAGMTYIDVPYEDQLVIKEEHLRKKLQKFCAVDRIIGMKNPDNYRNKVTAEFAEVRNKKTGKFEVVSGIYKEGSHEIIPIDSCIVENAIARDIVKTIREMLPSFKLKPYNEDRHLGFLRRVLIRIGNTGDIMVVLVAGTNIFPSKKNFVKALLKAHPNITTILFNVNDRDTSFILGKRMELLYGKGYIEDVLCGMNYRISPTAFYQVNHEQAEKLYNLAVNATNLSGKVVLDAYCGTGTIGIVASQKAKRVIGVELNKEAINDARINAKVNKINNITFYADDAGRFLTKCAMKKEVIDVVIMDPPRSGTTVEFMNAIARLGVKEVVYVSCDPDSLLENLKYFKRLGYKATKITPVDMFPYTVGIETVCLLSKGDVK